HEGTSRAQLADWLWTLSAGQPQRVAVAIEVPRGAIVEGLVERGFHVFAMNPKQLDRFRDRHCVAGANDDRRDAFVPANSLRTDQPSFRRLHLDEPQLLLLRELSRAEETLLEEFRRRANRLGDQFHRFYPQMLHLCSGADASWLWDLIDLAPTPAHAALLSKEQIQRVRKAHRLRRVKATEVLTCLQASALPVAPWNRRSRAGPLCVLAPLSPRAGRATAELRPAGRGIAEDFGCGTGRDGGAIRCGGCAVPPGGRSQDHRLVVCRSRPAPDRKGLSGVAHAGRGRPGGN